LEDMLTLREAMDRLFEESVVRPSRRASRGETAQLPVNMWEDEEALHVLTRVPGLEADDIDITVSGEVLTIRGRFPSDAERDEAKDWRWYSNELWFGPFERTLALPTKVQHDKADALFKNGVLHLKIAKAEELKPKTVKVKVAQ
jgi:HSP20 family protein